MKFNASIAGLERLKQGITRARAQADAGMERGLKRAGLLIQRAAQKITPVDLGPLYASAYTRKLSGSGARSVIAVGFTASYAAYVHEETDRAHGVAYNVKYAAHIARKLKYYHAPEGKWKGGMVVYRARGENQQSQFLRKAVVWNFDLVVTTVRDSVRQSILK